MDGKESNLTCDIRKSIRRYNDIIYEYENLGKRKNLINSEILCNLKELENEISYLRFHLRYLAFQLQEFNLKEAQEVIKQIKPKRRKKYGV